MTKAKKFTIWYKARFLNYPFYRVTYKDGQRTRGLCRGEAKSCHAMWGGRLWIDYSLNF